MADVFASPNGSNTAPYDTWAKAATTLQTACSNIADANGGHRVVVAPKNAWAPVTSVNQNGLTGNRNQIIGDPEGKIADSGGNYHGVTPGPVFVKADASYNAIHLDTVNAATKGDFFDIKNIFFLGTAQKQAGHLSCNGLKVYDCGFLGGAMGALTSAGANDATGKIFLDVYDSIIGSTYGLGFAWGSNKLTAFPTTPQVQFHRCTIFGRKEPASSTYIGTIGHYATVNNRTFSAYYECTLINYATATGDRTNIFSSGGSASAAYSNVLVTNCLSIGCYYVDTLTTIDAASSGNYWHGASTSPPYATKVDEYPALPIYLIPKGFPLADVLPDFSGSRSGDQVYDMLGQDCSASAQTPGAIEFISTGQYLDLPASAPTGRGVASIKSNSTSGSSNASRSRLINRGGCT